MKTSKQEALERAGWRVGDAGEFLDLSDVEAALIDVRLALATELKARRRARKMSQAVLAQRVGSSQSRVAKMEAADRSVSIDLLVRCLLALGSTRGDIGRAIAERGKGLAR
ncbi:MAG TPA: XRE family transcriptional regulator [Actinobacteria bacterium]|nr:XRE family transcriptional regulator [Actinomycetota bacterium]